MARFGIESQEVSGINTPRRRIPRKVARIGTVVLLTLPGIWGCTPKGSVLFFSSDETPTSTSTALLITPIRETSTATSTPVPTLIPRPTPTRVPSATPEAAGISPTPTVSTVEASTSAPKTKEWIYGKRVWQDGNWFPLSPAKAAREGMVTLEGSLGTYDKLSKALLGQESHFQSQYINFAVNYLNHFPQTAEWAGFCHGLAHAELLDPQPLKEPETFTLGNGEKVIVTYQDRLAIQVASHSGDVMFRPILGESDQIDSRKFVQENLDIFIDGLINTGQSFVVSAPTPGRSGLWYRVVVAVSSDKSRLFTTNLNAPGELMSISRSDVSETYIPMPRKEAEAQRVDPRLLKEISNDWIYSLNESLVQRILYGHSLN